MGTVIIQEHTSLKPITLIGEEAGVCYNSASTDEKNYKRGLECIRTNHGRTLEFPQVYMILDGYSARVIREFYTHICDNPSRLQASTRYIKYGEFDYIIPKTITEGSPEYDKYVEIMTNISDGYKELIDLGVSKEDVANILPLGMTSKVIVRTNLRSLISMSKQRLCTRAYWEFRQLMNDITKALAEYSSEWKELVENEKVFYPKCDDLGYCPEKKGCGRYATK